MNIQKIEEYKRGMEHKIDPKIVSAIGHLGWRVTAADVVKATGESLACVQQQLNGLAAELQGTLEVSSAGVIVYVFPKHVQARLIAKTVGKGMLWLPEKFWRKLRYLFRMSFGINLIVSLVISTILAILILSKFYDNWSDLLNLTSSDDKDKKEKEAAKKLERQQNRKAVMHLPRREVSDRFDEQDKKNLEGLRPIYQECFLWLFGERNPNLNLSDRQWQSIANAIRRNGGVATIEQVAPYLVKSPTSTYESAMLPVLVRFNGRPEVTEAGDIIYLFPEFEHTAVEQGDSTKADVVAADHCWLTEFEWERGELGAIPKLVGINAALSIIVLVAAFMDQALGEASKCPIHHFGLIGWCLFSNALGFIVMPRVTQLRLNIANSRSACRNAKRKELLVALQLPENQQKLLRAQSYGQESRLIRCQDVVYHTAVDSLEQEIEAGAVVAETAGYNCSKA